MAVVVVRDDLGLGAHRLSLASRLHHRRALAPDGARRLQRPIAHLLQRGPGDLAGRGLRRGRAGRRDPAGGAEDERADEAGHRGADPGDVRVRAAAQRLGQRRPDHVRDVAVVREVGDQFLGDGPLGPAAGHLRAVPVEHGDELLLAGGERERVEQVPLREPGGAPRLLDREQMAVRDRGRLIGVGKLVPVDLLVRVEREAAGERPRDEPHSVAEAPHDAGLLGLDQAERRQRLRAPRDLGQHTRLELQRVSRTRSFRQHAPRLDRRSARVPPTVEADPRHEPAGDAERGRQHVVVGRGRQGARLGLEGATRIQAGGVHRPVRDLPRRLSDRRIVRRHAVDVRTRLREVGDPVDDRSRDDRLLLGCRRLE